MWRDLRAIQDRDPAATSLLEVLLLYPGLHALWLHRAAHALWRARIPFVPRWLSHVGRWLTGIDIHPGASIGRGFFIDHGAGVVIGETAVVGEDVTLYQGVTLGGTGKERGKRHPTIGSRVVVGAGAKVLGRITVGDDVYIGANAVVLRDIPSQSTVVGVPGRITRREGKRVPGVTLDHTHLPDPVTRHLALLEKEVQAIEQHLHLWVSSAQESLIRELIEETESGVHSDRPPGGAPDAPAAPKPREGGL
jgi:serine O-acetyltransferase